MSSLGLRSVSAFLSLLTRFRQSATGQIAIIFGVASLALVVGVGAGIDLSRAYLARQKLSEVATLTCQFSTRSSVVSQANSTAGVSGGFANYLVLVNAFASSTLTSQGWNTGNAMAGSPQAPSPGGNYFTATAPAGTGSSTMPTNPVTEITANVPTYFLKIANVTTIPVHARVGCSGILQSDPNLISEGFEPVNPLSCATYCFTLPSGATGTSPSPQNTFTPSTGYKSSSGYLWNVMGYCVEVDTTGVINSTSPEGSHTAELDCDNGSGSAGNSSISSKVYLQTGYYELRYFFRSRIPYVNYDPAYICGSTAADVSWANDQGWGWYGAKTNQINVYFDQNSNGSPPTHTTLDGSQQLAGSNLIDVCVQSTNWIERSVKIKVTTPAYYWLSFAADGHNDSYGGQLDNIRLCPETCAGTPQDNFPSQWLAANNGGVNKVLFEDKFEIPVSTQDPYTSSAHTKGGNLASSYGTTVTTGSCFSAPFTYSSPPGWPCQVATGWAVAPYNEAVYWMQGATQGSQYISLQGWNPTTAADVSTYGYTHSGDPIDRSIGRKFLLDPGYYNVSYYYTSLMDFSYDFIYGTNCTAAPTVANNYSIYGLKNGHDYGNTATVYSQYESTNILDVFMSNAQLVSTPNINSALGAAATYTNPDGTTTSSPTVAPDSGTNFAAYSSTAPNPVIDSCTYSSGFAWVTRSVNIKITKPGWYGLTFSAQGDPLTALGAGPGIDDVKLSALGSPSMANPPTSALTTIPVPTPQPNTNYTGSGTFNGFYIVADPLIPPAADQ